MSAYHGIPRRLHDSIVDELTALSYKDLPLATMYSPLTYQRALWSSGASIRSIFSMYRSYGFLFNRTGYMASHILPHALEREIRSHIENWFHCVFKEDLTVRLQVVWGGCIPLHRDKTRNASLIVPVLHGQPAITQFYTSNVYDSNTRTFYDPKFCELFDQVCIDSDPVLIDTTLIHGVRFEDVRPTAAEPRISIAAKWRHNLFKDLVLLTCR